LLMGGYIEQVEKFLQAARSLGKLFYDVS
jgi:hypothetical protein